MYCTFTLLPYNYRLTILRVSNTMTITATTDGFGREKKPRTGSGLDLGNLIPGKKKHVPTCTMCMEAPSFPPVPLPQRIQQKAQTACS